LALFGSAARLNIDALLFQATNAAEAVRTDDGWLVEGEGRITVHA
jgi:hypothetical protein